jgi:hypothetical protein
MLLFDFSDPHTANAWHAIDDRVMGGLSRSTLKHDPAGHAVFEGTVSLERNGGFASVRSSPAARGLAGAAACAIEIRGDNKQFKPAVRRIQRLRHTLASQGCCSIGRPGGR